MKIDNANKKYNQSRLYLFAKLEAVPIVKKVLSESTLVRIFEKKQVSQIYDPPEPSKSCCDSCESAILTCPVEPPK